MQRRRFVRTVAGAVTAAGLAPGVFTGAGRPAFGAWTWVHGNRERARDDWLARFERLRAAGFTGVLVSGGDTTMLAEAAHAVGLAFHRWVWILNRNGDAWAQANHPEWFTISRNGDSTLEKPPYVGYYKWVCPTRPPVRAYLRDLVTRVAREPGVDGVHFDYIRFCDVILPVGLWARYGLVQDREYPEYDFCYCEVCRETFAAQSGVDPLELPDPPQDARWRRFRWDTLTACVTELANAVRRAGERVTAAVFPTPSIARRLVRQAWDEWPLDAVFPMLYHSFYEESIDWIGSSVGEGVAALGGRAELKAGLYLPALSPSDLETAVRLARRGGAAGVSCFEMEGLTADHLAALSRALA